MSYYYNGKTIYQEIMEECPENFVGNHCSDLYVLLNEKTKEIIERHYKFPTVMATVFTDQTTGKLCYEIPFGYDPKHELDKPTIKRDFPYVEGKIYYYIGPRSAWDTVLIGLFDSRESAEANVPINCSKDLVKEASITQVKVFFGIHPYTK